jgi:lipoate-protein ligase A
MTLAPWRLLRDPPGAAGWNMSVDEALLISVRDARPVLRLYTWQHPTITLGYRQKPPPWLERCAGLGIDVARRTTGGGTVLHADDLTYAVCVPRGCTDLPRGLRGGYEWVRAVLIEGLQAAGIAAIPAADDGCADRAEICFAGATGMEISVGARKLVGSAQRRGSHGWLQHGSIRLCDDSKLYETLGIPSPGSPPGPLSRDRDDLARSLIAAFEAALDRPLAPVSLSDSERNLARERQRVRWADPLVTPPLSSRRPAGCADRLP